jgi:hypothetical protein
LCFYKSLQTFRSKSDHYIIPDEKEIRRPAQHTCRVKSTSINSVFSKLLNAVENSLDTFWFISMRSVLLVKNPGIIIIIIIIIIIKIIVVVIIKHR